MDVVSILECNDEKLYNLSDIVIKFKKYFGYSIEELKEKFLNYNVCYWEVISDYLEDKNITGNEKCYRQVDYNYYKKSLSILSDKGLQIIGIIEYLCNDNKHNIFLEKNFEDLEMYHYGSVMKGKDINKIIILLFHLLNKFNETLKKVNNLDHYLKTHIDSFAINYGGKRIYPNEELIVFLDNENYSNVDLFDKTSFVVNKRRVKTRNKMVN